MLRRGSSLLALGARSLEISLGGAEPPSEFRLFKAGENETTKGSFVFDAEAASAVLARASEHGVDLMVDLEHLSLDTESRSFDPDARAWLNLEVRNGELWAVNVRWTEDGVRRLRERTQRYISPAFLTDDDNRVIEIVNIALTAMPATHGTPALVAANRRPTPMKLKDRLNALAARLSLGKATLVKLADDGGGDAPAGKFAAAKSAADAAAQALADFEKASGGSDVDATFAAMEAAVQACDAFETAVAAIAGGSAPADADPAPAAASDAGQDDAQKMARLEAEVVSLRKASAEREHEAKVAKLAAELDERRAICASLVRDRGMRPADVWVDPASGTTPKAHFASMSLADLRELARSLGTTVKLGGPRVPNVSIVTAGDGPEMSEAEAVYVKARHAMLASQGQKIRSLEDTTIRYLSAKHRQLAGAKEKNDSGRIRELTAPLRGEVVELARNSGLVMLASTPVVPIEEFGASSQIALQSFRLEYNISLASMPAAWAETIGQMLSDGALKTVYPISYDATEYQEKTAPNAAANQPQSFDLEVKQRHFFGAKQVELRRLIKGDFAYVQRWAQSAAEMARARVFLRNKLVATLLEAGTSGYWGSSSTLATGIDGQPFFSATHKNNPTDPSRKLRTVATFSNYQSSATPLSAAALTAEKAYAMQVAAPDGRELGITYDGILYPSSLEQTAYNLLKVQDLILDAKATQAAITGGSTVSNAFGQVRNPHLNSGLEMVRAMDLAGTDTTANYYLYSREGIGRGMPPWVICEDPTEELRLWDESSDFYKSSDMIKVESNVYLNAVLAFPHCIRFIKGA